MGKGVVPGCGTSVESPRGGSSKEKEERLGKGLLCGLDSLALGMWGLFPAVSQVLSTPPPGPAQHHFIFSHLL